jgi:hypothetical protein
VSSTEPATTASIGSVVLDVVECPTSYGGGPPSTPTASLPSTIAVNLPSTLASELSYYSNGTRTMEPLMGPKGWSCQVAVGADGSVGVQVFPGRTAPSGGSGHALLNGSSPDLVAFSDAACQGCVYATVCAYVPAAATQLGYTSSGIACPALPAGESVDWISGSPTTPGPPIADAIAYEIPAAASSALAVNGLVLYRLPAPGGGGGGAASGESCALPDAQRSLCTAALNDFVTRSWMLP